MEIAPAPDVPIARWKMSAPPRRIDKSPKRRVPDNWPLFPRAYRAFRYTASGRAQEPVTW